jgi:hypothetical protein
MLFSKTRHEQSPNSRSASSMTLSAATSTSASWIGTSNEFMHFYARRSSCVLPWMGKGPGASNTIAIEEEGGRECGRILFCKLADCRYSLAAVHSISEYRFRLPVHSTIESMRATLEKSGENKRLTWNVCF